MALKAYWSLNGIFTDQSGNPNTLTPINSPTFVTGKKGQGLNFNGTNQRATLASNIALAGAFSFAVWFKRTVANGFQTFTGRSTDIGANVSKIGLQGNDAGAPANQILVRIVDSGASVGISVGYSTALDNKYNLLVVARDVSNVIKASLNNGAYVTASALTGTYNIDELAHSPNVQHWAGAFDEVRIYDHELTVGEIYQLFDGGALNESLLVGYWQMDGNPQDKSGNGNTLTEIASPIYVSGQKNNAIQLNGTSQYLTAATSAVANFTTNDFSVTGWFRRTVDNALNNDVVTKLASNIGYTIFILTTDNLRANIGAGAQITNTLSHIIALNTWYFFAVTFDRDGNSTLYLYKSDTAETFTNSVNISAQAGSVSNAQILTIGRASSASSGFFPGLLDEIRIYNHVLSQEAITQIQENGLNLLTGITKVQIQRQTLKNPILRAKVTPRLMRSKSRVILLG